MDKELIKKWVAALRSGEYKQVVGVLAEANGRGFCCLGVATAIAVESKDYYNICRYAGGECVITNSDLRNMLGLDREVADGDEIVQLSCRLMQMNDNQNRTFPEIADYIEKELLSDDATGA